MKTHIEYRAMKDHDIQEVIILGNKIHGAGYLNEQLAINYLNKGIKHGINASFIALDKDQIVGFRFTFAAGNWDIDTWCTIERWPFAPGDMCYFKTITVADTHQGLGIGSQLLALARQAALKQGAKGGVCHSWMQSPNNSALRYIKKAGGKHVATHYDKWNIPGYFCDVCQGSCHCTAAEMYVPLV